MFKLKCFSIDLLAKLRTAKLLINRSSRPHVFFKKCVLKNLTKRTGKHLCQSVFNNVARLMPATLLKKRLWHSCFPVNFPNFLRTHFFTEHSWVTASDSHNPLIILGAAILKNTFFVGSSLVLLLKSYFIFYRNHNQRKINYRDIST